MAQLAIKGHPTRGKEVIALLEMLGGLNKFELEGNPSGVTMEQNYVIENGIITLLGFDKNRTVFHGWSIFTLEEFLEKFPYKVGDKVQHKGATSCGSVYEIVKMEWSDNQVEYTICNFYWINCKCKVTVKDLQPYKEETMEGKIESFEILESHCSDEVKIEFDPSKFEIVKRNNGYYVVKKHPQYPKTYIECAKILDCFSDVLIDGYKNELLERLQGLLICRDAYWKIAGDWRPEFRFGKKKYCIMTKDNKVISATVEETNRVFVFPTEEMRDAFFENFKNLIEECKELL